MKVKRTPLAVRGISYTMKYDTCSDMVRIIGNNSANQICVNEIFTSVKPLIFQYAPQIVLFEQKYPNFSIPVSAEKILMII